MKTEYQLEGGRVIVDPIAHPKDAIAASQAVSLKRIADALEGGDLAKRLEESLGSTLNENTFYYLGQSFGRGAR